MGCIIVRVELWRMNLENVIGNQVFQVDILKSYKCFEGFDVKVI